MNSYKGHLILFVMRREHDYSQQEIAKFLGIDKQTYYRKESGKGDFTISEGLRLCEIFNCTLNDLFGEKSSLHF